MRGKANDEATRKLIAQVYASGKKSEEVKAFFGIGNSTLYNILDDYGVERHKTKTSEALKAYAAKRNEPVSQNQPEGNSGEFNVKLQNTLISILKNLETISTQNEEVIGILDQIRKQWGE